MHVRVADAGQAGYQSQLSTQPNTADGLRAGQSPADRGRSGGKCRYTYLQLQFQDCSAVSV